MRILIILISLFILSCQKESIQPLIEDTDTIVIEKPVIGNGTITFYTLEENYIFKFQIKNVDSTFWYKEVFINVNVTMEQYVDGIKCGTKGTGHQDLQYGTYKWKTELITGDPMSIFMMEHSYDSGTVTLKDTCLLIKIKKK